jgi:hypothetical protein
MNDHATGPPGSMTASKANGHPRHTFGGTSVTGFGATLLKLAYPPVGGPVFAYEDFPQHPVHQSLPP